MVISSSTAQDKEIEGFDNRSGPPFCRRRVLEGRLAARELGVSKQGQGRIGTKARPIGKLPEAAADSLRHGLEMFDGKARGDKVTDHVSEARKFSGDLASAREKAKQGREAVEAIAERAADQDPTLRPNHTAELPGARCPIGEVMHDVRQPGDIAGAIAER
jgi:hypothetical protein